MRHFIRYDNTKTYYYLTGKEAKPEDILEQYPATAFATYIMETDRDEMLMLSMDMLSMIRGVYNISDSLNDDEAIAEVERISNLPPEVDTTPTAEERIASALEFQTLMSMPDTTE
jgi:hypothetical protein